MWYALESWNDAGYWTTVSTSSDDISLSKDMDARKTNLHPKPKLRIIRVIKQDLY